MQSIDFTSIYEQFAPDVLRFVRYLTANADYAEDITAETFLRAWVGRGGIRATTAKSYLLTIAHNLVMDRQRRKRFWRPLDFDARGPHSRPESKRYLDQTMEAVQRLDEAYRVPLVMHAVGELSYDEIAHALQVPVTTVKIRIHRARLQLAERLGEGRERKRELA